MPKNSVEGHSLDLFSYTTFHSCVSICSVFIAVLSGCAGSSKDTEIHPSSIVITGQPGSQTVTAGHTATFSILANSLRGNSDVGFRLSSVEEKWQRHSVNATAATYTTPATTTNGDSGGQFTVDVTDSSGSIVSNLATLVVNPVPTAF